MARVPKTTEIPINFCRILCGYVQLIYLAICARSPDVLGLSLERRF